MNLIDKDTLVSDIKERIETYNKGYANGDDRRADALDILLHDINTLEVKEVDLEKEIDFAMPPKYCWSGDGEAVYTKEQMRNFAKHFFELGLKAQQNINIDITNIDKVIEDNGVDPNSKEAKMFKESYYMALEKLKAKKGE